MTSRLLSLAALALAASVLPAGATTILLNTPSSPAPGSSFDVTVQLTGVFDTHPGDALAAFGFAGRAAFADVIFHRFSRTAITNCAIRLAIHVPEIAEIAKARAAGARVSVR